MNQSSTPGAVAASKIPVISAVGHETDFTICDFAADRRAPTPSAAAEIAVPDTEELKRKITNIVKRESALLSQRIIAARAMLQRFSEARCLTDPKSHIDDKRMRVALLEEKLTDTVTADVAKCKNSLALYAGKLSALDPLAVLSRGYGAVFGGDGNVVKSTKQLRIGEKITLRMSDGTVDAEIREITGNK